MSIIIKTKDLLNSLQKISKVVPQRSTLPILSCVKISSKNDSIQLSATNLETSLIIEIEATTRDEEDFALPVNRLLEFVGLYQKRNLRAGDLSFGQQKLLELAMALMNEPKMLLLDEPTAGINPTLINGIIDRLIKVNKEFGITLLVIEHNMRVIMSLAQKIFCLAHGELIAEGSPEKIKNDKRVIDAYLGAQ